MATNEVVTRDILHNELQVLRNEFRAEFYRAALIQGGVIIGAVVALVKLL
ncbi:MAG: hypothetical protein OXS47_06685 [Chloroflexota bacterium]|nr:hypothetical protein [Chloroflexota bacterium]